MRKIIITTGYMLSGSSAATDLVSEFENVSNQFGSFEYIFLHCPNGVFDLEDKLLRNNNSIRSDEALRTFKKEMKTLYSKKLWWPANYKKNLSPNFYKRVNEYCEELIDVKTTSLWYNQQKPTTLIMNLKIILYKILKKLTFNKIYIKQPLRYKNMVLCYKDDKEFYNISKKFINNVINDMDINVNNDMLMDQLLLPHNLYRMENYFDDNAKVIIVERDPRDVFILNKYKYRISGSDVPFSFNVEDFCKQYKALRNNEEIIENKNILRVKFEDFVYKYDEIEKKVADFLGYDLKKHTRKFERFDPKKSIMNTQVYLKNEEYNQEIAYIEEHLKNYLYDFDKYK